MLNFYPAGFSNGLILTGIGMMILAGMVIVCSMIRRRDEELAERESSAEQSENLEAGDGEQDV